MILHVKNGALSPAPKDPVLARKRATQLAAECARINEQLRDPSRRRAYEESSACGGSKTLGNRDYDGWRRTAEHALRMHNLELRLLTEWLEQQSQGMLRKARDLLLDLVDDDVDFDAQEMALIEALDNFVKNVDNSVG